jgi:hypothetical protein
MKLILFLILLLILLFIFIFEYKEGMEICKYKYLNPPPLNSKWNPTTTNAFVNKYNKNNTSKTSVDDVNSKLPWIWEEEAEHYIQYDKFPLNPYITEQLRTMNLNVLVVEKKFTNRLAYVNYIIDYDKETPTYESLSSKIFTGKVSPPACSDNSIPNKNPYISIHIDKEKIKGVCSKLKN